VSVQLPATKIVYVKCKPCFMCGETATVVMPEEAYKRWAEQSIQHAWPEGPADKRELLITGLHDDCFKATLDTTVPLTVEQDFAVWNTPVMQELAVQLRKHGLL